MTAAAECSVHHHRTGLQIQLFKAFVEENRSVVELRRHESRAPPVQRPLMVGELVGERRMGCPGSNDNEAHPPVTASMSYNDGPGTPQPLSLEECELLQSPQL